MTGIEQRVPKERHRSEQVKPDRSTSQQSVGFALSKVDPNHHDLEPLLDALCGVCYDARRSDAMITIEN